MTVTIGIRSAGTPPAMAIEVGQDLLLHGVAERADGEVHFHFVGNDVALGAAMNCSHCHHGRVLGRNLAADDGLDGQDVFGREDDRVLAGLGACAVRSHPAHGDVD
jgi:hypothetical protein